MRTALGVIGIAYRYRGAPIFSSSRTQRIANGIVLVATDHRHWGVLRASLSFDGRLDDIDDDDDQLRMALAD
jgi:hypothetical protein